MLNMLARCGVAFFLFVSFSVAQNGSPGAPARTKFDPEVLRRAGTYHALIIGNNDYANLPKLETAVKDAQDLANVLRSLYGFQVKLLLNATREQVMRNISEYRRTLDDSANLLIYYAGHGELDRDAGRAYWLPVDAEKDNKANWISADDVTGDLRAMPPRHVIVIADSCYSGAMRDARAQITPEDKNRFLLQVKAKKSRTLMTSGAIEPVADGGGAVNSVFAEALLQGLSGNDDAAFSAGTLFSEFVRIRVGGRSRQTPLYSALVNSGDQGGDFVFIRSANATLPAASTSNTALEFHNRATLYYDEKKWVEAEAEFQKAVALEPTNSLFRSRLGAALWEQRKYAEAEVAYREASRLDPRNANFLSALGNCRRRQGNNAQAEAAYRQGLAIDPQHFWLNWNLADVLCNSGQYTQAEPFAKKTVAVAPGSAEAQYIYGKTLAGLKRLPAAEAAFKQSLEIDPKWAGRWNDLGNIQYASGNNKDAEVAYKKAIELDDSNSIFHSNLAAALVLLGKYPEAASTAEKALQLNRENPRAEYWLGRALLAQKRYSEAERHLRHAVVAESGNPDIHNWLAGSLNWQSRWEEAALEYKEAIRLSPASAYFYSNLADNYKKWGRPELAEPNYVKAIELAPADLELKRYYGVFLADQQRLGEAKKLFTSILEKEPENWLNSENLAYTLLRLKEFSAAEVLSRKSVALKPQEINYVTLGEVLEAQDRPDEALKAFEQAAAVNPTARALAHVQRLKAQVAKGSTQP